MESLITTRYNDDILQEAMRRFSIDKEHISLLDGFESYIYAFTREDGDFILRIGHSHRRTINLIKGEVDWINYLAKGGAGVAQAILSSQGNLVEAIDDGHGGQFLATAFVKAPGRPAWEVGWSDMLYEKYGQLLGRIHALSKTYTPADPAWTRWQWNHPENMEAAKWLSHEPVMVEKFDQVLAHLEALPKDDAAYGLIHQDAHSGNFFTTDDGQITLFDFDDCVYSWFIYDIAMVLFYRVVQYKDTDAVARAFWSHFWRGYCRENQLDLKWLDEIPVFLKLREIDLYAVIYRSYDDPMNCDDEWARRFLHGRRERILNDVPLVTVDFRQMVTG